MDPVLVFNLVDGGKFAVHAFDIISIENPRGVTTIYHGDGYAEDVEETFAVAVEMWREKVEERPAWE